MKNIVKVSLILILLVLVGCDLQTFNFIREIPEVNKRFLEGNSDSTTAQNGSPQEVITPTLNSTEATEPAAIPTLIPSPTPTPDPLVDLYNCQMQIDFISGPLESERTSFSVLGEDYFDDKGDKFAVGKGTAVYYEVQRYLILHSSYLNGNIFKPMEAEFMRKYLENWGDTGEAYIEEQIDGLLGSEVRWTCDKGIEISSKIDGVIRLSHEASDRLWLEPRNLDQILLDREGLTSEWVGEIDPIGNQHLLIGFCGWGPRSLEEDRYTYYRYLINFRILEISS